MQYLLNKWQPFEFVTLFIYDDYCLHRNLPSNDVSVGYRGSILRCLNRQVQKCTMLVVEEEPSVICIKNKCGGVVILLSKFRS